MTAASFTVLLGLTTPWDDLLGGLRVLRVPHAFLTIAALGFRYAGVLAHAAAEMFVARQSRAVGRATIRLERSFAGGAAGALFGKTLALAEEVHGAMVARGFTGEARPLRPLRFGPTDLVWLGGVALTATTAIVWSLHG